MNPFDRLLLTAVIAGVVGVLGFLLRIAWRSHVLAGLREAFPTRRSDADEMTLHYFWSEGCAPCKVQDAQLEVVRATLAAQGASVRIARHDAVAETGLVRDMRVVTVPTTVIIAGDGQVIAWNPGFTGARTLLQQIRPLLAPAGAEFTFHHSLT